MPKKKEYTQRKRRRENSNIPNVKKPSKLLEYNQKKLKSKKINSQEKLGPWSLKDDQLLISLVEDNGPSKWSYISTFFPGRIGKQCRERWCNHLSPMINKCPWLEEEEIILFLLHRKYGNKWSLISNDLKGRTDNTIKNHWNSTMKKKIELINKKVSEMFEEIKFKGKDANESEIVECEEMENILLEQLKKEIKEKMKKVNEEKRKLYEKFKKMKFDSNSIIIHSNAKSKNIRKALGFRTHAKKCRKKGRKKTMSLNHKKEISKNKNQIGIKKKNDSKERIKGKEDEIYRQKSEIFNIKTNHFSAFKNYSELISQTPINKGTESTLNNSSIINFTSARSPFIPIQKPIQIICENNNPIEISIMPKKNLEVAFLNAINDN